VKFSVGVAMRFKGLKGDAGGVQMSSGKGSPLFGKSWLVNRTVLGVAGKADVVIGRLECSFFGTDVDMGLEGVRLPRRTVTKGECPGIFSASLKKRYLSIFIH